MKLSCMAFDGAVSRGRGDICKERGTGDAEPDFLAFHIAARLEWAGGLIDTELGEVRVAGCLGGINDAKTHGEQRLPAEQMPRSIASHSGSLIIYLDSRTESRVVFSQATLRIVVELYIGPQ